MAPVFAGCSSDVNVELLKGSDTKRTQLSLQKSVDFLPLTETLLDSRLSCSHDVKISAFLLKNIELSELTLKTQ